MFKEMTYLIKVTNECNLRCDYCFTNLGKDKMDISVIKELLAKSKGFNKIELVVMGGEPLMAGIEYLRDIRQIVDSHIKETKQFVNVALVTNGMMLEDEHFELFDNISISYDGHKLGEKGNGYIRRKIKQYGNKISVVVVANKRNYMFLQSIYDELESFGVRRMHINFDVYASKLQLLMFKREVDKINYRKARTRISMLDNIDAMKKAGHYSVNYDMMLGTCNLGSVFGVEPNGDLRPSLISESKIYGNLKDFDHIIDVYNTPGYIQDSRDYINNVSNDLIQGSFLDNMVRRNNDFRTVLNNKEALIC